MECSEQSMDKDGAEKTEANLVLSAGVWSLDGKISLKKSSRVSCGVPLLPTTKKDDVDFW